MSQPLFMLHMQSMRPRNTATTRAARATGPAAVPLRPAATYPAIVGRALAAAREKAGLTQAQLAATLGVTQGALSRIESGTHALTIEQLARAATALQVAPSQILVAADAGVQEVQERGVEVVVDRQTDPVTKGLAMVGAATLGAMLGVAVAAALYPERKR